jgi:hypothetical protein
MDIQAINTFLLNSSQEEQLAFFAFDNEPTEKVVFKFDRWARMLFPEYFKKPTAPFHYQMVTNYANSYLNNQSTVTLGFRGCAKSSLAKLFIAFAVLNDQKSRKKYIKVLTKDLRNSKKTVTDIFNMLVTVKPIYGEIFIVDKETKQEETMSTFQIKSNDESGNIQINAGTVGQQHRGHLQGANRPDWLIFDDIEDKESIRSVIITTGIIDRCDEALSGMALDGSYIILGNYISKSGSVQWFLNKAVTRIVQPILDDDGNSTWPGAFTPEIIQKCKENTNDWWGEYMQDPERSESSYFDLPKINEAMQIARAPFKTMHGVKYWATPEQGHRYAIGADVGEGSGKDASTMVVMDFTTNEVVATYINNTIPPNLFANELLRLGAEFNFCVIAPERNNNGVAVIENIREYPAVFQEVSSGLRSIRRTDRMGWYTSKKSKPIMFDELRRDFNKGEVVVYDMDILKEMRSFSYGDITESEKSLVTRHWDVLTALAIANQMRKHAFIIQSNYTFEEEPNLYEDIGV